jgi:hypothetical protein
MKKAIPVAVAVLLLGASGVLTQGVQAQSKSGASGSNAASDSRSVPQAPVGHRQPRANEVPSAQEKNYTESDEDKALDRKIKSICRGC